MGFFINLGTHFQLIMCGSNMEAIYDKRIAKHLLPVEYLPDDYTGPNNGTIKELVGESRAMLRRKNTHKYREHFLQQ